MKFVRENFLSPQKQDEEKGFSNIKIINIAISAVILQIN